MIADFEEEFQRNQVGVVFSPYVKNWLEEFDSKTNATRITIPNWSQNSYPLEEIQVLLGVLAKKFSRVSTYGVGAGIGGNYQNLEL
jgi:hypothetical protein